MSASLYRMFDAADALLYVGICAQPRRLDQHRKDKGWWPDVARISIEHFEERADARAAERQAIVNEAPLFNVQHRPSLRTMDVGTVEPPEAEIGRRLRALREDKGWSRETLGRKSDTAPLTILRAEVHGSDPAGSTLLAWATALDVTVSELVGDHDPADAA